MTHSTVKAASAPNDDEIGPLSWLFDICLHSKTKCQLSIACSDSEIRWQHAQSSGVFQSSHLRNCSRKLVVGQEQILQAVEAGDVGNHAGQSVGRQTAESKNM